MSVIAGWGAYCLPDGEKKPTEPYTHVEVGFPSDRPEPWDQWQGYADERNTHETVFAFVPVNMVRDLVQAHGGEASHDCDR